MDDMKAILDNPKLSIGINGCSLKTEDNLKVVAAIPTDRIMLETDCPWCDCRPSHASAQYVRTRPPAVDKKKHQEGALVKGRNEPCNIVQVLEVVAGVKGLSDESDLDALCAQIHQNTRRVFFS